MAADTGAPGILKKNYPETWATQAAPLAPDTKCASYRLHRTGARASEFPSVRQAPETWRRPRGGRISAPGKFPGNSREISRKFLANSRKSDYAVILFVRAFPGNFPETFFGFPEKKKLCHRNILGCVTGKFEKPPGGRYKPFREY